MWSSDRYTAVVLIPGHPDKKKKQHRMCVPQLNNELAFLFFQYLIEFCNLDLFFKVHS